MSRILSAPTTVSVGLPQHAADRCPRLASNSFMEFSGNGLARAWPTRPAATWQLLKTAATPTATSLGYSAPQLRSDHSPVL